MSGRVLEFEARGLEGLGEGVEVDEKGIRGRDEIR
jgi:hypothetical protein